MFGHFKTATRFARHYWRVNAAQRRNFTAMMADHTSRLATTDHVTTWGIIWFGWGAFCLSLMAGLVQFHRHNLDVDDEYYNLWKILRDPIQRASYERGLKNERHYKDYLEKFADASLEDGQAVTYLPLLEDTESRIKKVKGEVDQWRKESSKFASNASSEMDILNAAGVSRELLANAYTQGHTLSDNDRQALRRGIQAVYVARASGVNSGKVSTPLAQDHHLQFVQNHFNNILEQSRSGDEQRISRVAGDLGISMFDVTEYSKDLGSLKNVVNTAVQKDEERNKALKPFAAPLYDKSKEKEITQYWRNLLRTWETQSPPVIAYQVDGKKEFVVGEDVHDRRAAADNFVRQHLADYIEHPEFAIAAHILSESRIDPVELRQHKYLLPKLSDFIGKKTGRAANLQDMAVVDY